MSFSLLSRIKSSPLLCDGAMGTQLVARGLKPGECPELWNLTRPEDVCAIHSAYRHAGCQLLTTNTFGGTRTMLAKHGQAEVLVQVNQLGASLARQAAGDECLVLGDVGPFGDFLFPAGDATADQAKAIFVEQLSALAAGGADGVVIETMSDPAEAAAAVSAAKMVKGWPVIATYAFTRAGNAFRTMMGSSVSDAVQRAISAGADVVGANCGANLSLEDYVRLAEEILRAAGQTPVAIQANAGSPRLIDGELTYDVTPEQMADLAAKLAKSGVKIIGGCCGTAPEHMRAMANVLRSC